MENAKLLAGIVLLVAAGVLIFGVATVRTPAGYALAALATLGLAVAAYLVGTAGKGRPV